VRRRIGILVGLLLILVGPTTAGAEEADQVKLRKWFLGVQGNAGGRDTWDVFGEETLPPAAVDNDGNGGGVLFGYRFGDRFLLGLQLALTRHDMVGVPEELFDIEFLVTGTVLFRERHTFQPFLRGGFGAGAVNLERPGGNGNTTSLGTAAIGGAGFQIRLSSRFSLEWEIAGTFTNFLEVYDHPDEGEPDESWRVKTSHIGLRNGIGVMVWF
jgi:hypothetical protein